MNTVIVLLIVIIIAGLLISRAKWKISTLAMIYYIEKNQYKLPSDEDMKECTDFVAKNTIKDLFGH